MCLNFSLFCYRLSFFSCMYFIRAFCSLLITPVVLSHHPPGVCIYCVHCLVCLPALPNVHTTMVLLVLLFALPSLSLSARTSFRVVRLSEAKRVARAPHLPRKRHTSLVQGGIQRVLRSHSIAFLPSESLRVLIGFQPAFMAPSVAAMKLGL